MAFVLTYNNLVTNLLNYLERDDQATIDAIPTFILFAQTRIARDAKTLFLETYVTNLFTNGSNVLQKPANWLNTITFNVGNGTNNNTRNPVILRDYEWCRQYWPDDAATGLPKYYCDYGYNNWLIVPTPDQNYPFELAYEGLPTQLDINNQTNQLTQNAPELLFYACLREAYIFLKDIPNEQISEQLYGNALQAIQSESVFRQTDRYSERNKD